jgi:hypothetical protein
MAEATAPGRGIRLQVVNLPAARRLRQSRFGAPWAAVRGGRVDAARPAFKRWTGTTPRDARLQAARSSPTDIPIAYDPPIKDGRADRQTVIAKPAVRPSQNTEQFRRAAGGTF